MSPYAKELINQILDELYAIDCTLTEYIEELSSRRYKVRSQKEDMVLFLELAEVIVFREKIEGMIYHYNHMEV